MFEVYLSNRLVLQTTIEGGGYSKDMLNAMARFGYTFKWGGKKWKPQK